MRVQSLARGESPYLQERGEPQLGIGYRADVGATSIPIELEYGLSAGWQVALTADVMPDRRLGRFGASVARGWFAHTDGRSALYAAVEGARGSDEPAEVEAFIGTSLSPSSWRGLQLVSRVGLTHSDELVADDEPPFTWHAALVLPWRRIAFSMEAGSSDLSLSPTLAAGFWLDVAEWAQVAFTAPRVTGVAKGRSVGIHLVLEFP